MGVIQQSINQTIGTAGIMARLSPGLEKKQELRKLEKEESISKQRVAEGIKSLQGKSDADLTPADFELHENIQKQAVDVAKRKFELDPTEENFKTYEKRMKAQSEFKNIKSDFMKSLEQRQIEAMQKVADKQDAQLEQKENFMNYLKNQPLSFGGKFGGLDPVLQEKIYAQLNKENKDGK